jgi:hypothetical protein
MDRPRLSPKQAEALRMRIRPMLHFLLKCRRRLEALNFNDKSVIFQAVDKARSATCNLHVELIYISCARGVGKASGVQPEVKAPPGGLLASD